MIIYHRRDYISFPNLFFVHLIDLSKFILQSGFSQQLSASPPALYANGTTLPLTALSDIECWQQVRLVKVPVNSARRQTAQQRNNLTQEICTWVSLVAERAADVACVQVLRMDLMTEELVTGSRLLGSRRTYRELNFMTRISKYGKRQDSRQYVTRIE